MSVVLPLQVNCFQIVSHLDTWKNKFVGISLTIAAVRDYSCFCGCFVVEGGKGEHVCHFV